MKRILIFAITVCLALPGFSGELSLLPKPKKGGGGQWIVIGLRGEFASTWLLNSNVMNDKNIKYRASFGGGGGVMLGVHLSRVIAIEGECLYTMINQKYKGTRKDTAELMQRNLAYLQFPVLLHFDFESFKYLEVGVMFSSLKGAKGSYSNDRFSSFDVSNADVKPDYEKANTSLVFGWGSGLWGNGGLLVNFGIRATYGLSDIVSDLGGKGNKYYSQGEGFKDYKATNTATIGFHFNIDFDLGWFMSSNCGRKHTFVLFGH